MNYQALQKNIAHVFVLAALQFLNNVFALLANIGVASILSGVHFFPKKLTTFFSHHPQKTV